MQGGFRHTDDRDVQHLPRSNQGRIERDRQDRRVMAWRMLREQIENGVTGDGVFQFGRDDRNPECRCHCRHLGACPRVTQCLCLHQISHRLGDIAVDQQQFHSPSPTN